MTQTYRPDPIDWGARTLFILAGMGLVVAGIGFLLETLAGVVSLGVFELPLLDWLVLPLALLLGFDVLTLWYYRQSVHGSLSEPFPLSLSSPWEGIIRFFGVLFLLYLSFLLAAFALIVPQLLSVPVLADLMARIEPDALLLGALGLFGYLVLWYAHNPSGDTAPNT